MRITPPRAAEFEGLVAQVLTWAARQPDVSAVGLAGSWANGTASMDSDVDLVVVCASVERFENGVGWVEEAVGQDVRLVRTQWWEPLLERRVVLPSGLEVEFGFVTVAWADTDPVDAGTARVIVHGFQALHDPSCVLKRLMTALGP